VSVDDGQVTAVGLTTGTGRGIAAPGFVDLQVNGFAGVDFATADQAAYRDAAEAMLATGVTAFQPTFISAPESQIVEALRAVPRKPGVIGAHLEGPFLSPRRPGAHDPRHLRAPDRDLLGRLLDAGPVAHVTLAPELHGAHELIDELRANDVTVAAGHTDATAAQAHAAFDRGVRTVTHLFNAMRPSTPRDPGIALAALARPDVTVQLIVDGHHLAPETVTVAHRAALGRLALVTDAVAVPPGHPPGEPARTQDGRLAGTTLTMIEAVRNLHALGAPLHEALTAASTIPADIAGRPDLGRIRPGGRADIVVLDDRLEPVTVLTEARVH
jgi:N-acetylglucosamine-6-phosphate deacetylase